MCRALEEMMQEREMKGEIKGKIEGKIEAYLEMGISIEEISSKIGLSTTEIYTLMEPKAEP